MKKLPTVTRGSGPRFVRHTGVVVSLPMDVDGAIRYMLDGSADPGFVFNQERYRDASILIAGKDFGEDSAPVSAVTQLMALGLRAVIAPGFEPQFYSSCLAFGVLPVILDEALIGKIADQVATSPGVEMTVDLERQIIEIPGMEGISFNLDARERTKLLQGLNDLDEIRQHTENVVAFRSDDRNKRPWVYDFGVETPVPATLSSQGSESGGRDV